MLMKKINVKAYMIEIPTNEGVKNMPYNVVSSIENILLASGSVTSQRLTMSQTLANARVAEKIKAAEKDGYVLLEDSEFDKVKKSFESFSGYGKTEVELCKRIEEVETVDVEEKKKK